MNNEIVDLPGVGRLREAVEEAVEEALPEKRNIGKDALAGLIITISSVPNGMAGGVLAGVNPLFGLYANITGPIVGAIFSSTPRMVVATTAVTVLVAGQALGDLSGPSRESALFLMVVLSGVFQILCGILKLDRVFRFVSYSVMTGFLAGISALLILSQVPTITGIKARGANTLEKAWFSIKNIGDLHPGALMTAAATILVMFALARTRLSRFSTLLAIVVPSVPVAALGWQGVELVRDVGEIAGGLPALSDLNLKNALNVITGALSLAVVILVQGLGVSQSVPMPTGKRRSQSRDFVAQGAANVASGLFQGVPVGGSLSTTAISILAGGRSRWAAVFGGLSMAVIVIGLSGAVSRVAMPALGALLMFAGFKSIKPDEVASAWRSGLPPRISIVTSFVVTLLLPIQVAVLLSILLSTIVHLARSSLDIRVVELVRLPDGRFEERSAPKELIGDEPTVLDVYGNLFFAGARTLAAKLPRPEETGRPVVILRLRGHIEVGATLAEVLAGYAGELHEAGGRLYVSGLSPEVYRHLKGTKKAKLLEATPILGESTRSAFDEADAWLEEAGQTKVSARKQ